MDTSIQAVLLGVLANALTALVARVAQKGETLLIGEDILKKRKLDGTALEPILQKAIAAVAEGIHWEGPQGIEEVCLFLGSPDVEAIVRQVFSASLSEGKRGNTLELIRQEFLALFSLHIQEEGSEPSGNPAGCLFDALIEGCENALNAAVDEGILSAHEAKSAARHQAVLDELATVEKNLSFLSAQQRPDVRAILAFEEKYRQQVADRHKDVSPPHFDALRKVPIDQIYVSPNFERVSRKKNGEQAELFAEEPLPASDFISLIYRAVVLGNPGAGKSTFTAKLCHDVASRYAHRPFAGREAVPILIVLRDYGAAKKAHSYSILQFIEATANSKYQVQPPVNAIEYLLLNGRAIVIFDGLDELLDTSYRREVSGDVESFCTLYPSVPLLVTSREVGYEQAPLDEKRFEILRIAPFGKQQVSAYVRKWFAIDTDLTASEQEQKAEAFLEESEVVADLRSNPLMLALMCNIYRGENYIPRNRPDVYEKCALMLFERWDKVRGIYVPLPFEAHISPAMKHLAHWIYADEGLQSGVTEKRLVAEAANYLCAWRFEDRDEAERAAREFIAFCRGRAWVFTDTGTTKEGERLYQFTHRTFLEYFTAAHLVRIYPTPESLAAVLFPRIAKREWDVVAQLACQLQNKNVEGAADSLLSSLVEKARDSEGDEGWNMLSFATRCLEFIVPSPRVARDITIACINRCVAWGLAWLNEDRSVRARRRDASRQSLPQELLGDLVCAAAENRNSISHEAEWVVLELAKGGGEQSALIALEIGLHPSLGLGGGPRGRRPRQQVLDFWADFSDRVFAPCLPEVLRLSRKYFRPCLDAFFRGKVTLADLVQWHGVQGIFRQAAYVLAPNIWSWSPAEFMLITSLKSTPHWRRAILPNCSQQLEESARILVSSPLPWFQPNALPFSSLLRWIIEREQEAGEQPLDLSPDGLFGCFALVAAYLQAEAEDQRKLLEGIMKNAMPVLSSIRSMLIAPYEHVKAGEVEKELSRSGFNPAQREFARRWARGELSLVQSPSQTRKRSSARWLGPHTGG